MKNIMKAGLLKKCEPHGLREPRRRRPARRRRSARWLRAAAMAAMALVMAGCGQAPSSSEARAYAQFIGEKQTMLGQAIILQGRLLESYLLNNDVLEEGQFMDAEQILAERLKRIGAADELEALALPTSSGALESLHGTLAEAVRSLSESARVVDEGAYTQQSFEIAEAYWLDARRNYVEFTAGLLAHTGRNDEIIEEEMAEPSAGVLTLFE